MSPNQRTAQEKKSLFFVLFLDACLNSVPTKIASFSEESGYLISSTSTGVYCSVQFPTSYS